MVFTIINLNYLNTYSSVVQDSKWYMKKLDLLFPSLMDTTEETLDVGNLFNNQCNKHLSRFPRHCPPLPLTHHFTFQTLSECSL